MENEIIVQENPVLKALKDDLFLVICILMSIACGLNLIGGFPVILILLTVFLWITFAKVNRGNNPKSSLRYISGTVTAQYVLNYVTGGLIILLGVLIGLIATALFTDPEVLESMTAYGFEVDEMTAEILTLLGEVGGWVIGIIFGLAGVGIIIYNALAFRPVRKFAKAVYENYDAAQPDPGKINTARIALWVIGIFAVVGSFSLIVTASLLSALAMMAEGGAAIASAILIKKSIA